MQQSRASPFWAKQNNKKHRSMEQQSGTERLDQSDIFHSKNPLILMKHQEKKNEFQIFKNLIRGTKHGTSQLDNFYKQL